MTNLHLKHKTSFVLAALISAIIGYTGTAFAQEADEESEAMLEEVIVTGSRISRNTNLDATVPTVVLTAQELTKGGMENLADVFTQMPQFAPSFGASRTQSTFSGVASSGLNLANLRNLGSVRTLTLLNGRRMPGGTSTSTAVDFNTIPSANIDRIELQTGGAAAVYGADAMAGVVNIITKKDFEGTEVGGSYGKTKHNDNENPNAYLMFGGFFGDGGHALFTVQYDKQGLVSCANRDFCSDDFFWGDPDNPIFGPNARSGVPLGGRFFIPGAGSVVTRNGSITDADGNLMPFVTSIDGYNRNAQRYLAIPTEREMAAMEIDYPVNDRISVFGEFNYGKAEINSDFEAHPYQSNRPGSTYGGGPGIPGLAANIPLDNPFLPPELRDAVLAADPEAVDIVWWQRFAMMANRGASSTRDTVRAVFGFRGDLDSIGGFGSNWNWEAYYVWGQTRVDLGTEGLVSTGGLYNGLRVEPNPDRPGEYMCSDPAARATGCIPINPFGYTQEMVDALNLNSVSEGTSTLDNALAYIAGDAFDLPAGPLQTVFGVEYRRNTGYLNYDTIINDGLATGNQISDVEKSTITTKEIFVEALVPILTGRTFAKRLDFEGASRYTDADQLGHYSTWKVGLNWAPIETLRFRAMAARAVRAPVPGELSGIGQTFGVVRDPCTQSRRNDNPTRAANCAAAGVPEDYNPGQIIEQSVAGLSGANPDLLPEEGKTYTYGFVWTPEFANLSVTLDRFDMQMEGIIDTVTRQSAVEFCYDAGLYCDTVTRGTNVLIPGATYVLNSVNQQLQNVAKYTVKGWDLTANYGFEMGSAGDLGLALNMVFYDNADKIPLPGEAELDLLGQAGGDTSDQGWIKTTGNFDITWNLNAWHANWNMRYVGPADMAPGTTEEGYPRMKSKLYNGFRFGWYFGEESDSELYAGMNNIFDVKPQLMCSGCSGTQALDIVPGYYDPFGRSWYIGFKYHF